MTGNKVILPGLAALLVFGAVSCRKAPLYDPKVAAALDVLDRVMLQKDSIAAAKEAGIDLLRPTLDDAPDAVSAYRICDALYAEYEKWNVDSAFSYAHRKSELASIAGDAILAADAAIDLANSYMMAGMYHDAIASLDRVDQAAIMETPLQHRYNYLRYDIYHNLLVDTQDARKEREYKEKEIQCLNLCDRTVSGDVIEYYNTKANILIGSGHPEDAISLMKSRLEGPSMSLPGRAMLNYWMAKAYNAMGDESNALYYYAVGARYDFLSPVKVYGSPISTTKMCFEIGDINRANRYVLRNYTDAVSMGARYRINLITERLPLITSTYESRIVIQNRQLRDTTAVLLILILTLGANLFLLNRNRNKLHRANAAISLQTARLEESNKIKDTYLGQFLSMYSEHIDSLERFRSNLRVTAKQMDFGAIQKELRSDSFVDAEWKVLFDKFDETFLGLFPDFPEHLNSLLLPNKRLNLPATAGKLNNELRIFALIRLGVTDSKRIAKFLRLSLPTVYNYRVKLRNASAGDRDTFEDRIKTIGSIV